MSEQELKTLLGVYQQKTYELFTQNVALEAKVSNLSSLVEVLTKRLNEITNPVQEESKPTKKTSAKEDSGEF
jgi:hypothetical protein